MSKWRAREWQDRIDKHDATVPQQVWDDISYEMARTGETCVDNYRAYKLGDAEGEAVFLYKKNRGCCGCFEGGTTVKGQKWIIGANCGH